MKLTHDFIERNIGWMIGLTILVVSVGGLVEIVPCIRFTAIFSKELSRIFKSIAGGG